MAASLVGGAAVGAVFGELLKAVLEIKDKAMMFKQTLIYLQSTLVAIAPVVKEIEQLNNDLGRPKEELESLIREMEKGTKFVCKCSKVHRLNYLARVRNQEQLVALVDSLVKFFIIDMQAQTARDQKETLLKVRRILRAVNKFPLVNREDTVASSSDSDVISESETHYSSAMETISVDEAMEHIDQLTRSSSSDSHTSESKSTPIQQAEEAAGTNYADQVMEPITGTKQEAAQSKAKARNNQGMKHLVSEKSFDHLRTIEKRLFSIRLPKRLFSISYRQVKKAKIVFLDSSYSFDLEDVSRGSAEVLGKGSYGTTYKATLEDGSATVVVKRLTEVKVSKTEFEQQMKILQTLLPKHPNVCPLRAYCYSSDEILLFYDYIAGGSFSALMHERWRTGWTQLDWKSRMKISLAAAKGIAHVHSVSGMNFVHGNIKPSNVLVTADFQGCISDFGLTRLLRLSDMPSGTKGYQAPEVIKTGKLTQESDVYSFGILLLEMMTGKSPKEDPDLRSWVDFEVMDGLLYFLFDDAVKDDIGDRDMGLHMMTLARDCASWDRRPSMNEVVRIMEDLITSN